VVLIRGTLASSERTSAQSILQVSSQQRFSSISRRSDLLSAPVFSSAAR
jgi:hypothetical protein